jgi:hypothetical protein
MQGAKKLRREAHLRVRRNDEVEAQRRRWTFYKAINFDEFVKSKKQAFPSFRRKPESSYFNMFWTPAFAGVTTQETFYETINFAS